MWDVFANQSENFEISSTPFTVSKPHTYFSVTSLIFLRVAKFKREKARPKVLSLWIVLENKVQKIKAIRR